MYVNNVVDNHLPIHFEDPVGPGMGMQLPSAGLFVGTLLTKISLEMQTCSDEPFHLLRAATHCQPC